MFGALLGGGAVWLLYQVNGVGTAMNYPGLVENSGLIAKQAWQAIYGVAGLGGLAGAALGISLNRS